MKKKEKRERGKEDEEEKKIKIGKKRREEKWKWEEWIAGGEEDKIFNGIWCLPEKDEEEPHLTCVFRG